MKTNFEKLNEQEMISVTGGDRILKIIDENGFVIYIIVHDGDETRH